MAEKIYCSKCGREIKEGLLYCDRCGQSVKKSAANQAKNKSNRLQAEEIHREQINRKKRRQEREERRKEQRRKSRRRAAVLGVIIGILILGFVCAVISYIWVSNNSSISVGSDTPAPATEAATQAAVTGGGTAEKKENTGSGEMAFFERGGISCPYPASFAEQPLSEGELMHLTDGAGAVITIAEQQFTPSEDDVSTAQALMEACYDEASVRGNVTENRFGSGWYVVVYGNGTRICHRKCVISGAQALYYSFEYDSASPNAAEYAALIESMDKAFTAG